MHNIKAILLSVILVGCTSQVHQAVDVVYPMPAPIKKDDVKWHVITKGTLAEKPDNAVFVGLTWKDSLKHRQYLEDMLNYIKQQQIIICKYQKCE